MNYWTVHLRPDTPARPTGPVLVREGFSWGALLFGPIWLLAHRAWIPAVILLALNVAVGMLASPATQPIVFLVLALLVGLSGNDLLRFALERRGYRLIHVVAARDEDGALARLLASRPDLAGALADGAAA